MLKFPPDPSNEVKLCFLVSDINPELKFTLLDKEPLVLGRTKQTGIEDLKLSKSQVEFEADYSRSIVLVEQLGPNESSVNDQPMTRGEKRILYHGDKVSLLFNANYIFYVNFVPNTLYNTFSLKNNKRPTNCIYQSKKFTSEFNIKAKWETKDDTLLVYNSSNLVHEHKIAAFDLDKTIIVNRSGKISPVDYEDWKIISPLVPRILRQLFNDNYKIVIFTYEEGIGNNKVNEYKFKKKIENIFNVIGIPVQVFVATLNDMYRKPAPGMWDTFVSDCNGNLSIDMNSSFFCGDSAGRLDRLGNHYTRLKKDHSCYDRLFAINIGLKFYSPQEYFFESRTEKFILPLFNPNNVLSNIKYTDSNAKLLSFYKEIIIMVGSPSSGKSYFASNVLGCHDLKIITCAPLGTLQDCVTEAKKLFDDYTSCTNCVVIDYTNPDKESRKYFIDLAKSYNISCRIFLMNVSKEHARHNNKFRELTDKEHQKVSDDMINEYFSKFEQPSMEEGVDEIVHINFVPHFKDPKQEKLYKMYLL